MASTSVFDFSISEKNALIAIYEHEIKALLQSLEFATIQKCFATCFDNNELKKISVAAQKGENSGKGEIVVLISKAHDPRVFVRLMELVAKHDPALERRLLCSDVYDLVRYRELLATYNVFKLVVTDDFLTNLIQACVQKDCINFESGQLVLNPLKCAEGSKMFEATIQALAVLLSVLPRYHKEWYWIFMNALAEVPSGMQLREVINKNFVQEHKNYEYRKTMPLSEYQVIEMSASFDDWLHSTKSLDSAAANQQDPITQSISDDGMQNRGDTSTSTKSKLALRNYQITLSAAAVRGDNTVICAPTGSGKTYMAANIISSHFGECSDSKKKVAFLVPMVQLVDQQFAVFKECLSSNLKIKRMMGGTAGAMSKIPRADAILAHDIVITTPQVLLNVFRDSECQEPVTLSTFSLIILDECHHTDKNHAYNELMTAYLDKKYGNPNARLPQIVGLTATLGVGKADDEMSALGHVMHVAANLDAHTLSTITEEHYEELANFVNVPTDRVVPVKKTPHPFTVLIESIMSKIERIVESDFKTLEKEINQLRESGRRSLNEESMTFPLQPPAKKSSPQYNCWVCTLLTNNVPKFGNSPVKPMLTSALEHLRVYHETLDLNAHVPYEQAMSYLSKRFEEFERKISNARDRQLVDIYERDIAAVIRADPTRFSVKNDLVESLTDVLLTEFKKEQDARVLIFVRTRQLTLALEEFMQNDIRLKAFNGTRLTSSQVSKEKGGQTSKVQVDLLERFRNGHHRIVIATTIAEEGLDIEKCQLVIKYNHVTNEIAMVQRRGRGRAAGSESVLLVQDDWIEEKEGINVLREDLMRRVVQIVRAKGHIWFKEEVAKAQEADYKERSMERYIAEQKRKEMRGKTYDMLCKKCDTFIISTSNMRKLVDCHYVAVEDIIWQRLYAEPDNQVRVFSGMVCAGKVSCKECRNDCGRVFQYRNTFLPALKIEAMSLKPINGPPGDRLVKRKWAKAVPAYFVVDDMENSDLREMHGALDATSTALLEENIAAEIRNAVAKEDED